jgi:hypothetical protein
MLRDVQEFNLWHELPTHLYHKPAKVLKNNHVKCHTICYCVVYTLTNLQSRPIRQIDTHKRCRNLLAYISNLHQEPTRTENVAKKFY